MIKYRYGGKKITWRGPVEEFGEDVVLRIATFVYFVGPFRTALPVNIVLVRFILRHSVSVTIIAR